MRLIFTNDRTFFGYHAVGNALLFGVLAVPLLSILGTVGASRSLELYFLLAWLALTRMGRIDANKPKVDLLKPQHMLPFSCLVLLCLILLLKIMSEPIQAWDARSIWYFHAKIVFFGDGFLANLLGLGLTAHGLTVIIQS